ncbi:MAG: hypothetical protein QOH54_1267 [Mycobacterium sp.]|jgi:hypothetical protein|nr:hypothetical protein [Mycobacterium sp.]
MKLTPEQRKQRAQIAANVRWSKSDAETRLTTTQAGRDAANQRFIDMVDPQRKLGEAERAKLVKNARAAYFQKLAFNRSRNQQARKAARADVSQRTA